MPIIYQETSLLFMGKSYPLLLFLFSFPSGLILSLNVFQAVRQRLQDLCLGQGLFSDIVFQLDDGSFAAHRPMLMARCDMMKAMFSGDFRESSAKVVSFCIFPLKLKLRLIIFHSMS